MNTQKEDVRDLSTSMVIESNVNVTAISMMEKEV